MAYSWEGHRASSGSHHVARREDRATGRRPSGSSDQWVARTSYHASREETDYALAMSACGYQLASYLPEAQHSDSSRRMRHIHLSDGRCESRYADAYSPIPARGSAAGMSEGVDIPHKGNTPRYTGQQLPDFVLFPPERRMSDKTTYLRDYALDDTWGNYVIDVGEYSASSAPSVKRSRREAPGTQNRAPQYTESPRGLTPAATDYGVYGRASRGDYTERIYYPPSPPNAPSIPRLPTPDFNDVHRSGGPHGRRFCTCCPPESEDEVLSDWRGRSKMDRQSKYENSAISPPWLFEAYDHKLHMAADTTFSK